jgi:hypothetical protein
MAVNGIQFPPGMSLVEFFQQRGTEVQREGRCRRPIGRRAFGARVVAVLHTAYCVLRAKGRKTFQWDHCRHQTSIIAGTLFLGTKLPLTVWFLIMYLFRQAKTGLSALARLPGR